MLNKMLEMINGLEQRDLMLEDEPITENDINEFGFILIRDGFFLNMCGINIAGAFKSTIEKDGKNVPMIIVDNDFYRLSESCKIFTLAHEMGHFKYHFDKTKIDSEYVRNINDEFEADEYAVTILGLEKSIEALSELSDKLYELYEELAVTCMEEINIRIENLINKYTILN